MKTPETDELVEKSSAYLGGAYLTQDVIDLAKRLEIDRNEWRAKACDKDGTPWSTISEWWRAKFEAAERDNALTRRQIAELAQAIRDSGGYMSDFKDRHARLLSLLSESLADDTQTERQSALQ